MNGKEANGMIIKRIRIRSFGKLRNEEMELSPGMNVLYGENESGKTTLHTFLRCMFYGISRQRGRAAKKDTYATYEPWEEPAAFGGILWFENGGKQFRLSRSFHPSKRQEELICEDDEEVLSLSQGDLDAILGDISEVVYENTVSVAQLKSVTGQDLIRELQNYMASYQGTGDSSVDLGRTMQMLKMIRKGYQVQQERRERELQTEREKLDTQLGYAKLELEKLEQKVKQGEEDRTKEQTQSRRELLLEAIQENQKHRKRMLLVLPITVLLTVLLAVGAGLLLPWFWIPLPIALVGMGAVVLEYLRLKSWIEDGKKLKKWLSKEKKKLKKADWELENQKGVYAEQETAYRNLQKEALEQALDGQQDSVYETEIQSLNLAMFTISTLSERFQTQVGGRLRERTSQILSEITGGKYREVLLDRDFHMTVNTRDRIVTLDQLSRGTLEQIYFALRMAAGELLCKEEVFPVILDDVFGMYDEERLAAVLHWLNTQNRQVIISTCNRREAEILDREGIPYHLLELGTSH